MILTKHICPSQKRSQIPDSQCVSFAQNGLLRRATTTSRSCGKEDYTITSLSPRRPHAGTNNKKESRTETREAVAAPYGEYYFKRGHSRASKKAKAHQHTHERCVCVRVFVRGGNANENNAQVRLLVRKYFSWRSFIAIVGLRMSITHY